MHVRSIIRRTTKSQLGQAFAAVITVNTVRSRQRQTFPYVHSTYSVVHLDLNPEDCEMDLILICRLSFGMLSPAKFMRKF